MKKYLVLPLALVSFACVGNQNNNNKDERCKTSSQRPKLPSHHIYSAFENKVLKYERGISRDIQYKSNEYLKAKSKCNYLKDDADAFLCCMIKHYKPNLLKYYYGNLKRTLNKVVKNS